MKILLDANLSWRLIKKLSPYFDEVLHSSNLPYNQPIKDLEIWDFTKKEKFNSITQDDDFEKILFLKGAPPKIIFLKTFNSNTQTLADILISNIDNIKTFHNSNSDQLLEIYLK